MTLSERHAQAFENGAKSGVVRQVSQLIRRAMRSAWPILPRRGGARSAAGGGVDLRKAPPTPPNRAASPLPPSGHVGAGISGDFAQPLGADLAPSILFAHAPSREYAAKFEARDTGSGCGA